MLEKIVVGFLALGAVPSDPSERFLARIKGDPANVTACSNSDRVSTPASVARRSPISATTESRVPHARESIAQPASGQSSCAPVDTRVRGRNPSVSRRSSRARRRARETLSIVSALQRSLVASSLRSIRGARIRRAPLRNLDCLT
jgi:hypothetical protein